METNDLGDNNITLHELQPSNDRSETGILSDIMDVIGDEMFQHDPSIADALNGAGAQPQSHAMDPTQQAAAGFNGNAALLQQQQNQQQQQQQQQQHQQQQQSRNIRRKVKITEQPASKALRFRYECEGRSAGSIPGVNSTPENKTFPTIEIVGYKGRAVVVVSCVTKDPPYRPHPHNLVGKEGCKKGVCTLEINSETMRAVFSNLGIQCVKKKDIEAALRAREDIRVDPFKTGFTHKFQPSSIDLNSVRLCFQVFLESDVRGRFTVPLTPVVSDPIYDKKAMSDLVICRLCSCSSTVYGGKEIILLCEKVAKEDISVRFFEEHNGQVIWEGFGDFQHTDVHKQTAIAFRTPRYRAMEIEQPAKVFIQLRRPSDGATSEPLPFDYLPLESGRRTLCALSKNLKRKANMDIFQQILKEDRAATLAAQEAIPTYHEVGVQSDIINLDTPTEEDQTKSFGTDDEESAKRRMEKEVDSIIDEKIKEMELEVRVPEQYQHANTQTQNSTPQTEEGDEESVKDEGALEPRQLSANDKIAEWLKSSEEFERTDSGTPPTNDLATNMTASTVITSEEDKTMNDLFDHSEELEEIYSEKKLRLETYNNTLANELASSADGSLTKDPIGAMDVDESFDDAATYTSLEMAFKNPYPMSEVMPPLPPERADHYDSVEIIVNPPAPIIDVVNSRSPVSNGGSAVADEVVPPLPPKRTRKQDGTVVLRNSPTSPARPPSQIIIMKTPDQSPPTKKLPPTPNNNNTLPRQKKPGFFSKLFSRRKSKSDLSQTASSPGSKATSPMGSREPSLAHFSLNDANRSSIRSLQPTSISASNSPTNGPKPKKGATGKPVGRSVSSVSGKRPHLTADVIHIPLKGDSSNSLPMHEAYSDASTVTLSNTLDRKTVSAMQLVDIIPINDGNMELVAIADRQSLKNLCEGQFGVELHPSVDLTEAEHFALYTSIPPQATASEFDETSCYYAPVDADPAVLKRKRQRLGADQNMHIIKHFQAQEMQQQHQQQHGQHQNDHTDGRNQQAMNFLNVIPNPAIKTEPRDTSPLPYGMYNNAYRIPDQTPSPQPVSPSTPYNHNASGTPSPYNMGAAGNGNLVSPSHQYGMAGDGAGAGVGAAGGGPTTNGSPMDYDAYHQQHHPGSINTFNHMQSPPAQWAGDANIKQRIQCQSISINLSNYNGILTKTAAPSAGGALPQTSNNQPWNLLTGAMANNYNINNLMTNTQHNQHHHHQPQPYHNNLDGGAQGGAAATAAAAAASTNEAPSISSLLNMDSDKLLHFNSEELSNLSIS